MTLGYCQIFKEMTGSGISNGEGGWKFPKEYLVEETEVNMELSDRIETFCGNT